jgi:hypothetical protein
VIGCVPLKVHAGPALLRNLSEEMIEDHTFILWPISHCQQLISKGLMEKSSQLTATRLRWANLQQVVSSGGTA